MHTFSETGAGVPAFLAKLWRLVDDSETNNLITWTKDGRSFIIQNQAQFARELLPLNYKHNNMASFIRQLNMYGFHKITSIENGGLKFDRDEMEFSHPCFKRDCPYLLEHIKRKIANTKSLDEKTAMKPEAVSKVLQDVKVMRGRQDSLDSRFSVMKQENEALWREIASLRQKHAKQQQIVNKLIQFLITIVQPSRNMTSVKRHMQLMINDTPENAKLRKSSESESEGGGPVIHELGEELLDEVVDEDNMDLIGNNGPYINLPSSHREPDPDQERPHSSNSLHSQHYDYSNQSFDDAVLSGPPDTPGKNTPGKNNNNMAELINPRTPRGLIQSVNADGQEIMYHVTEAPDVQVHDSIVTAPISPNHNEENVLTTPMVRQEIARNKLLKQQNKQRRTINEEKTKTLPSKMLKIQTDQNKANNMSQPLQIKAEQDPIMFMYPTEGGVMLTDGSMISPNTNSNQSTGAAASNKKTNEQQTSLLLNNNNNTAAPDLYDSSNFIGSDMPANLFEDSALLVDDNNSNNSQKLIQQQQFGQYTANNGKFSSYIAGNNNNNTDASTSTAVPSTKLNSSNSNLSTTASTSAAAAASTNTGHMAVTKYNKNGGKHQDIMRDEVNGHLDNVQDELDTLKDLLRGDGYSLDANTLLGLFNDSDILGPYGLSLGSENSADKKGSELMTYQPIYDLSDIINMDNEQDDKLDDGGVNLNNVNSSRQLRSQQSSALNTPQHQ